ncbi:MAG: GNAT family N-acetyltransferase [Cellvibrionales bacterium]|jgi:ribosomal protein S18 acetylase RimI-like enzyme
MDGIRPLLPEEHSELAPLYSDDSGPSLVALLSLAKQTTTRVWASWSGSQPVAVAWFTQVEAQAELLDMRVLAAHRRQGVGGELLKHALGLFFAEGVSTCLLEVRAGNLAALALYEQLGFRVVGRREGYYLHDGQREDALLMTLVVTEAIQQ